MFWSILVSSFSAVGAFLVLLLVLYVSTTSIAKFESSFMVVWLKWNHYHSRQLWPQQHTNHDADRRTRIRNIFNAKALLQFNTHIDIYFVAIFLLCSFFRHTCGMTDGQSIRVLHTITTISHEIFWLELDATKRDTRNVWRKKIDGKKNDIILTNHILR